MDIIKSLALTFESTDLPVGYHKKNLLLSAAYTAPISARLNAIAGASHWRMCNALRML